LDLTGTESGAFVDVPSRRCGNASGSLEKVLTAKIAKSTREVRKEKKQAYEEERGLQVTPTRIYEKKDQNRRRVVKKVSPEGHIE
jgi:hypothetical protein